MSYRLLAMCLVLCAPLAVSPALADSVKERTLTLQFVPQETTGSISPTLGEGISSRPVSLVFEDKRPPSEMSSVGEGTDDDDHLFPWRSSNSVPEFAKEVFARVVQGWGVRLEEQAELILVVRLARFFVAEKDQAVGSNYTADVRVGFDLKARDGTALTSGVAAGSARRYGRKRSPDNCNEVLSDAMKEAYANVLGQPGLQAAWSGKNDGGSTKSQRISPSALLAEVSGLKTQGFSTELLVRYINQRVLTAPLSAQDLVDWKNAGLPEPVIQAAMDRAPPPD